VTGLPTASGAAENHRIRPNAKPQLPVALIFACLVVVYVVIRFLWR